MNHNLLTGSVTRSLLTFSLPIIMGAMLQQFYNLADTFIVGKFIGADALAAVGSVFALITFLNSVILGLCMGSSVLFSTLFGAGQTDTMKNAFFISFVSIGILTGLLQILCMVFTKPILKILNTPEEIFTMTEDYVFFIFSAMLFTFIYNFFSSVLRSVGDSKTPLIFLALASLINIILDIVFIVSFKMGVSGAAIATLTAQGFSAAGLLFFIFTKKRDLIPSSKHLHMDRKLFIKIRQYSLLTCLQQSVMNFGILMIQGLVNSFGVITMSAFAAAVKIDSFAYMPAQEFGNGFSTFIAQNKGAGKDMRLKRGFRSAFIISTLFCIFISIAVFIYAPSLMRLFVSSEEHEIIFQGTQYLRIEGACYTGIGWLFLLYGYYRGIGYPGISLVLTIISLGTRVALSYSLSPFFGTYIIWLSIPIGWFLADITGLLYGVNNNKKNRHLEP